MAELNQALAAFEEPVLLSDSSVTSHVWPAAHWLPEPDARQVSTARPRLVAFGILSVLMLLVGLSSVVPSVELVTGKLRFSKVEVALILFGFVGTLITPAVLFFRHLRKSVWASHVKVLDHLRVIQTSMLWGLGAYGTAALAVRFLDDVIGRFGAAYLFGRSPGASFRGWNVLFLAIALGVSGLIIAQQRRPKSAQGRTGYLHQGLLVLAGLLIVSVGITAGLLWRLHMARIEQAMALGPAPSAQHTPAEPLRETPPAAADPPSAASAPAPHMTIERASVEELARASAKGAQGLIPLAERYPRDANVLKPLLLAFASRSTGLADAMSIMQRLFDVAPEETRDNDLRFLLRKAANTPGETSILAFSTMMEHMGPAGPDQLFELMNTNSRLSKRTDELLASDEVQAIASPALKIAYELRKAPNCAARLPLLERASELGDLRAVAILSPLTVGAKRGCGQRKRSPCPAPCSAEAGRYLETMSRIMARQPRH